jgi:hypothetical protein
VDEINLGGAYTWVAARRRGATRGQIRDDGVPVARGVFVSRAVDLDLLARCHAWALVLPDGAAFSHLTAASLLGTPVAVPDVPEVVLTPRSVLPQWSGLVTHARRLAPDDVVPWRGLRLTSAPQTFLDLAARLPPEELVAVGDDLMRTGHLSAEELRSRLARADRVRGVVRARACAPLLSPHAMSRPESLVRYWLTMSRLPDPQEQVPVHDRWGRAVCHADLGYQEWKVALEYEGRHHAEGDQFERDIDRYSLMAADGWLVLRFARRHLAASVVVDRTSRALVSRGWRPPPRPS